MKVTSGSSASFSTRAACNKAPKAVRIDPLRLYPWWGGQSWPQPPFRRLLSSTYFVNTALVATPGQKTKFARIRIAARNRVTEHLHVKRIDLHVKRIAVIGSRMLTAGVLKCVVVAPAGVAAAVRGIRR